jgi:diaminopimelate epimerase
VPPISDPPGAGIVFAKGHGTENDFVLYSDPDGRAPLTGELARALANRRTGIGADGVIRAVRTADAGLGPGAPVGAEWFMDYRNADGSLAEMCGNGIRVYAEYLREEGLADFAGGRAIAIATRGGVRAVRRVAPDYSVDMGGWSFPGGLAAVRAGGDVRVEAWGLGERAGLRVDAPNPHAVVLVDRAELDRVDLDNRPGVAPIPKDGANVEFVAVLPPDPATGEGRLAMRVHERGAGETRSCGTGAVAAAVAARALADAAPAAWRVEVPGGRLRVAFRGDRAELRGPAVLVASGRVL